MKSNEEVKDLEYYRNNCEENYITTPISVLRYIGELENAVAQYKEENERLKAELSQPKDIESLREELNDKVLLFLQGKGFTFSGDSVHGYPFVSTINEDEEINLEGFLEDFAEDILFNFPPHLHPKEQPKESNAVEFATYLITQTEYIRFMPDCWFESIDEPIKTTKELYQEYLKTKQ
ncbi:hypothetical protein CCP3SC1AL1_580017 [Gammaproteobacteria bacterium]